MARPRWLPAYWGRNPWWIPPHLLGRVPRDVGEAVLYFDLPRAARWGRDRLRDVLGKGEGSTETGS